MAGLIFFCGAEAVAGHALFVGAHLVPRRLAPHPSTPARVRVGPHR
jgi:hypothetical protein